MKAHTLRAGTIYEGDWLQAPLEPGYTLAILDGPCNGPMVRLGA